MFRVAHIAWALIGGLLLCQLGLKRALTQPPLPLCPLSQITFDVGYSMSLDKYRNDMSIAVGVLSAFAVVYAAVQTWGWSKRDGRIGIDFPTLLKFLLFTIGVLANVFLVVAFGSAVWWFIFYKVRDR
jgi:hypothetical protein